MRYFERPKICKHCGGSHELECFQNAWGEHGSDCPHCDEPADLGEWIDYADSLEEKIKKLERIRTAAHAIFNDSNSYEEPEHIAEMKASLKDMEPTMQERADEIARLENLKMKHPKFYNVVTSSSGGDFGCTHSEDDPVKIIVSLPHDDDNSNPVINHTISELVELITKSKEK